MCHIITPVSVYFMHGLNANNVSVCLCLRLSGAKNKTEAGRNAGENQFITLPLGSPQLFIAVIDYPPVTYVSLLLMSEETKPSV